MINAVSMELSDACGNDPGFICEWIWDNTENEKFKSRASRTEEIEKNVNWGIGTNRHTI